jgi:hypothetical protein
VLADMAVHDPAAFASLVEVAKGAADADTKPKRTRARATAQAAD